MTKTVSIIIPFKNEREAQLGIALSSINTQIGVDFSKIEVILVNDGGDKLNLEQFSVFENLDLHYYEIENVGPGLARQYGIDNSKGEYLMFIDSDDMLYYAAALSEFFSVIQSKKHDMIVAKFMEQYLDTKGNYQYKISAANNNSAVYAKWFKRTYLKEINLQFHPKLRIYEDSYFVGVASQLSTDSYYLDKVVYTWLYNTNSIGRKEANTHDRYLHVKALQCRLYLEAVREKQPQNFPNGVRDYMVTYLIDTFMRYSSYPLVNEDEFWIEHRKLFQKFAESCPKYSPILQSIVESAKKAPQSQWKAVDTSKFQDFMIKSGLQ
ncbi:glycosyltransferase family 2 protein [Lactococcus nasutitermitis]|uniref:Glycosyltransferase family 2 protein n=1 Tax=Lactococcus nasutitermitis TaxID=1652957 RepID=A0ABV9JAM2_9LACT|nr:glycosyltransferase family A protein [Lactococcus nasutitermitis]